MKRLFFNVDGVKLSYLEFGRSTERTLLALHGHFGTASMFAQLAENLPDWRVVSLDQRGHGWSSHVDSESYTRGHYIRDLEFLIREELRCTSVVILGHSLGGVNAYQLAAQNPKLVRAMIIEDIGAEIDDNQNWVTDLPSRVPTIQELRASLDKLLGQGAFSYFEESVVEYPDGWSFKFDALGIIRSQEMLNGSWWEDWLASTCPVLLMQGEKSPILSFEQAQHLVNRRPNTTLLQFPGCGHTIRNDNPSGYFEAIKSFLIEL